MKYGPQKPASSWHYAKEVRHVLTARTFEHALPVLKVTIAAKYKIQMGKFASSPHYSAKTCSEIGLICEVVVCHFSISVNIYKLGFLCERGFELP